MSYDISLYPRQPGQDWAEVVEADHVDGPAVDQAQLDTGVATFRRIEARLREQLTEPVEVWVAEETDGDVFGELTAADSGLQVELYDRSASVSFPVRDREDRALFLDQVRRAVRIVATETGYEAYDPQTGRTFDGLIEEEGLEHDTGYAAPTTPATVTAGESVPAEGAGATGSTAAPAATGLSAANANANATLERMDPTMLNRRAWLYLFLGVVLAVFGFMRFSAGETSWLTWLIIGFAAFNLLAGSMLRALAKQSRLRQEQAAAEQGTTPTTDPDGPRL